MNVCLWKKLLLQLPEGIMEAIASCFKSNLHSWVCCLATLKLITLQSTECKEYILYVYYCIRCAVLYNMPILYKIRQAILKALQRLVLKPRWLGCLRQNKHFQSVLQLKEKCFLITINSEAFKYVVLLLGG